MSFKVVNEEWGPHFLPFREWLPTPNRMKIVVTGASGKIGKMVAKGLMARGHHLVLHYYSSTLFPSPAIQADLSCVGEIKRLVAEATERLGGLDVLIHCASIFEKVPFAEVSEEMWDRALALDLKATFFLAQAAARHMKERGGKMIFFSDAAAGDPYPSYLPYCIAKAGVDSLAKGLAKVFPPTIAVHVVRPPGRNDRVEEVVEQVMMLVEED